MFQNKAVTVAYCVCWNEKCCKAVQKWQYFATIDDHVIAIEQKAEKSPLALPFSCNSMWFPANSLFWIFQTEDLRAILGQMRCLLFGPLLKVVSHFQVKCFAIYLRHPKCISIIQTWRNQTLFASLWWVVVGKKIAFGRCCTANKCEGKRRLGDWSPSRSKTPSR